MIVLSYNKMPGEQKGSISKFADSAKSALFMSFFAFMMAHDDPRSRNRFESNYERKRRIEYYKKKSMDLEYLEYKQAQSDAHDELACIMIAVILASFYDRLHEKFKKKK